MPVFGHRQLSMFFFPLVETRSNGFTHKGKRYTWEDVQRIEVWQEPWPPMGMAVAEYVPHGRITLKDRKRLMLNGRAFIKKDAPLEKGYLTAFDELIDLFEKQTRYNNRFHGAASLTRRRP
jgi:hypothetical protein